MIFKTPGKAKLCVASSPVHGKGLFAKDPIKEGDILGVIKGFRSNQDGSYVLWVTEEHAVRMLCKFKYSGSLRIAGYRPWRGNLPRLRMR